MVSTTVREWIIVVHIWTSPFVQIVVHAPSPGVDSLVESCNVVRTMTKEIFSPAQGETIQIGQQTNSFSISIPDELLASIKMSRVRIMEFSA